MVSCVAAIAVVRIPSALPFIWGDGIHDDGPGLNAFLAGKAVEFMTDAVRAWNASDIAIVGGTFLIRETVVIRRSHTTISGAEFKAEIGPDEAVITVDGDARRVVFQDVRLTLVFDHGLPFFMRSSGLLASRMGHSAAG
jgi:hypothetical protein